MITITNKIPGGNIRVLSQDGNKILLEQEQRDSVLEWFYWKFQADFSEAGRYQFRFSSRFKVGTRGPCISRDEGRSWQWQGTAHHEDDMGFEYKSSGNERVWFCQAMPYMKRDWERFVETHRASRHISFSTLVQSKKGRQVPMVALETAHARHSILLTARHHCQESMASYVLEGFLNELLAARASGLPLLQDTAVYAVPFADMDGVEDGDQGKGRAPRDHGRDYEGESLFPECAAIRELAGNVRPIVILDLHCPWIRNGNHNEEAYCVENSSASQRMEIDRFASLLEMEAPKDAPFFKCNTMRWGVDWNTSQNGRVCTIPGIGISKWGTLQPYTRLSTSMETPFANFGSHTIGAPEARHYGAAICRAVNRYLLLLDEEAMRPCSSATLTFTGDIMCNMTQLQARRKEDDSYDFSDIFNDVKNCLTKGDYLVGNLETCFAGEAAGYSCQRYSFNTPDSFADMLKATGFDLVSTAMNHCLDREVSGLKRTLDILDARCIEHTGTARTQDERDKILMRNIKGIKFAFVSYTYGTNAFANHYFLAEDQKHCVNLLQPQETLAGSIHLLNSMEQIAQETAQLPAEDSIELTQFKNDIQKAKNAGADMVVVLLHCGGQRNPLPDAFTRFIVGKLRSYGADLVIGNHPHVVQTCECVDGMPVFYCLGNLTCMPAHSDGSKAECFEDVSTVLRLTFEKDAKGTRISKGNYSLLRSVMRPGGKAVVVHNDKEEYRQQAADMLLKEMPFPFTEDDSSQFLSPAP